MAKLVLDFYSGNDTYDDGDVENELLKFYKDKDTSLDFNDDGVFYLTTDIRANILNWYPFDHNSDVLEIGTGCGTITELLCDKCKNVIGIEDSKRRAAITYHRHIQRQNLTVYAGNFEDIQLDHKFDYIVLVGVFEYAKIFFEHDQPFDLFLDRMKALLKPTGKILLAIENRYGIKYWAGCDEDHLRTPYIGLQGYEDTNIQTFGKQEFIDLIARHGFSNYKFYYPFPDHKLPSIIYTDQRPPRVEEVDEVPIYPYGNYIQYPINSVLGGLIENGDFGFFANSFLVEFGLPKSKMANITFAKEHDYRNKKYQITTIGKKHDFIKIPTNPSAERHIDQIYHIYNLMKDHQIPTCSVDKNEGGGTTC